MATVVQLRASSPSTKRDTGSVRGSQAHTTTRDTSIAQGLGWFSIGLGLAQVVAPASVARLIGVEEEARTLALMRAIGVRELMSGVGILSQRAEPVWLWGRVAGDAIDLALLAAAMRSNGNNRRRAAAAAAAVLGVAVVDAIAAQRRARDHHRDASRRVGDDAPRVVRQEHGVRHVRKSITINRSPEDVMRSWENATARPGMLRRLGDAAVSIEAGPRGTTEVRVALSYEPGNKLRFLVSKLRHSDPAQQLELDLRHLKQLVEVGEIVHSDASIHRAMHPARPAEAVEEAVDA